MTDDVSPFIATHSAGAALSRVPLTFSHDSTRLFATSLPGHVTAHSVATAHRLTSLHFAAHDAAYVHLQLNPLNRTQLVAVGVDGVVRLFDTDDGALLRSAHTRLHATHAALHPTRPNVLAIAARARYGDDDALVAFADDLVHVLLVTLRGGDHEPRDSAPTLQLPVGDDELASVLLAPDVAASRSLLAVKACHSLLWSADGRHLVCLAGRKQLKLCDTSLLGAAGAAPLGDDSGAVRTFHLKIPATVLALSPAVADGAVAVGDMSGRITVLRCLGAESCRKPVDKCVSTTLHWHAHGVNTIVFNHDGDYLYSGGEEGVLVSWQLRSGVRSFLPRLGAALVDVALSPDSKFLAIAVALNNVALVDMAASRVVRRINGLRVAVPPDVTEASQAAHSDASKASKKRQDAYRRKQKYILHQKGLSDEQIEQELLEAAAAATAWRRKSAKPRRAAAGLHVVDGVCVLNGGPNTLQFFDALEDRHVAEVEVARGKTTSHMFASAKVFTDAVVEHVAFSLDRLTLVTVDRRSGLGGTVGGKASDSTTAAAARAHAAKPDDMQLKFWTRADAQAEFQLHTRVEHAHHGPVTRLLYHPTSPLVVTSSTDGRVRTWMRRDAPARDAPSGAVARAAGKPFVWACRSTAEHRQGVAATDMDLCSDGSLLAVVYGASATLWAPFRVALLRTLTYPSREQPPLKSARFLAGAPLLATTTDSELHFWDLTSGVVVQSFRIGLSQIAVHPKLPMLVGLVKLSTHAAGAASLTSSTGAALIDSAEDETDSKKLPPLAVQNVLLFEPTKRALPLCVYRIVVGFNRRQRRREVQAPDALITDIAFATSPKVTPNALFALSRGGMLTCLQPADTPSSSTAAAAAAATAAAAAEAAAAPAPLGSQFAVPLPLSMAVDGDKDGDDENDDSERLTTSVARMSSAISYNAALERVFDGPSHAVPPLSALAESYLGALLRDGAPPPPPAQESVIDMDDATSNTSEPLLVERAPLSIDDDVDDKSALVEPQECFEAFRVFFAAERK
jgi:WD40 repeat protein